MILRLERLLWTIGLLAASYASFIACQALVVRRASEHLAQQPTSSEAHQDSTRFSVSESPIIGRLEIPALSLTVAILADDDPDSLRKGVGHIRGTALPGGLGTVGLAGHRDTFLRPLRHLTPSMDIRLIDASGVYHYQVDSTEIVDPSRVSVLDIGSRPQLTLITCFPFDYIGPAPRRFIVHAHLLSASADANPASNQRGPS
jgi:sortase A